MIKVFFYLLFWIIITVYFMKLITSTKKISKNNLNYKKIFKKEDIFKNESYF